MHCTARGEGIHSLFVFLNHLTNEVDVTRWKKDMQQQPPKFFMSELWLREASANQVQGCEIDLKQGLHMRCPGNLTVLVCFVVVVFKRRMEKLLSQDVPT